MFNWLASLTTDINDIFIIIWVVVFVLAIIIEFSTQELVSIWFALAALPSLILAACGIEFYWQIVAFAGVSLLAFILSQLFLRNKIKVRSSATNADSLIGGEIFVTATVKRNEPGEGRVRDVTWTIISDEEISKGEFALIKEIRGNKLVVKRKEENKK